MTQATALTVTIWPRVALFNYFAVPMPQLQPAEVVNRWYQINTRPSFGRSGYDWV